MSWTLAEIADLKRLHAKDKYFWKEIAEKIGKSNAAVAWQARALGLRQGPKVTARFGRWNSKHAHLREPVMTYFLNHTWDETRDHFKLSESHLKSIFSIGYKDPKLNHLRKDRRRHDGWSMKELQFFIRHAGLQPRDWVANKLKRGSMQSVKECASRLKVHQRYLNGLPERLANLIVPIGGIKTKAGAPGSTGECCTRIVSWAALENEIKGKKGPPHVRQAIRAMARFQRWVHNAKTNQQVINKIKRIVAE